MRRAAPPQAAATRAKKEADAARLSRIAAKAKVASGPASFAPGAPGGTPRRRRSLRAGQAVVRPDDRPARGADSLELKSGVALVLDQDTNEVLFSKNSQAVLPIASLTKLMTALVVTEAQQPLDETITITDEDIDTEKGSRSRLRVGTQLRAKTCCTWR